MEMGQGVQLVFLFDYKPIRACVFILFIFFLDKVVKLVSGGSVINGA